MTTVTYHKPKEGCDASIVVMNDEKNNICEQVALGLHQLYDTECRAGSRKRTVFVSDHSYVFENGLAFRLTEDPSRGAKSLEFLAAGADKAALLSGIPTLLQQTGLVEPPAAERLRKQIAGEGRQV